MVRNIIVYTTKQEDRFPPPSALAAAHLVRSPQPSTPHITPLQQHTRAAHTSVWEQGCGTEDRSVSADPGCQVAFISVKAVQG